MTSAQQLPKTQNKSSSLYEYVLYVILAGKPPVAEDHERQHRPPTAGALHTNTLTNTPLE